jgi:hypothetical protein
MMLSIFNTGGLTLVITLIFVILEIVFLYQAFKHSKAEGYKWYQSPFAKYYASGLLVLYILVMYLISRDYLGV